jgi:hypothetical protein
MKPTACLCSCGFKMLMAGGSETPKELRDLEKLAKLQKFHFSRKPYKACPKCGLAITTDATVLNGDWEDLAREMDIINAQKTASGGLQEATKNLKNMADSLSGAADGLKTQLGLRKHGIDLAPAIPPLLEAVELLRLRVNEFADDINKSVKSEE